MTNLTSIDRLILGASRIYQEVVLYTGQLAAVTDVQRAFELAGMRVKLEAHDYSVRVWDYELKREIFFYPQMFTDPHRNWVSKAAEWYRAPRVKMLKESAWDWWNQLGWQD